MEKEQKIASHNDHTISAIYGALSGKRILVTGAGSGIGLAFVKAAVAGGAKVVAVVRKEPDVAKLHDAVGGEGRLAGVLLGDVSDFDWAAGVAAKAAEIMGGLDALVNSAGVFEHLASTETSLADWQRVVGINLTANFIIGRGAAEVMARGASIIFISSQIGLVGHKRAAAYASSKSGLNGLTRAMALELAERGIRVNAVAPGPIETPMTEVARGDAERYARMVAAIPMGRFGTSEECAATIAFFASDASSFITGQILCVDGGIVAA